MADGNSALFASGAKERPPLPPEYTAIYESYYLENRNGTSPASSAARRVERGLRHWLAKGSSSARSTLELGAGTLNQLPFEAASPAYDAVEPMAFLYRDSPCRNRVRAIYADVTDVPPSERYDRITSCGVLEHVCDLDGVVASASGLMAADGVFKAVIPSEGGALWKLSWMMTTGLEFRLRHKLDYGVIMRHEHINSAREIEASVKRHFRSVRVQPVGMGMNLSLFRLIEARL